MHLLPVVLADALQIGLLGPHKVERVQVLVAPPPQAVGQLLLGLQRADGCTRWQPRGRQRARTCAEGAGASGSPRRAIKRTRGSGVARRARHALMNPALSKSLCDTAALMTDSAKSSTTSTLLPFLSGV